VPALHANQGAEADLGDRFVACLVAASGGARLPAEPRPRAAPRDYIRRATDEVMVHGPADARVPAGLSTPRRDFDGLPG